MIKYSGNKCDHGTIPIEKLEVPILFWYSVTDFYGHCSCIYPPKYLVSTWWGSSPLNNCCASLPELNIWILTDWQRWLDWLATQISWFISHGFFSGGERTLKGHMNETPVSNVTDLVTQMMLPQTLWYARHFFKCSVVKVMTLWILCSCKWL